MPPTLDDDFDAYAVLRVHPAAEPDVIRAAYRALARLYHPDIVGSEAAREQMVRINRAWAILGDPTERSAFDRSHRRAPAAQSPVATPAATPDRTEPSAVGRRPASGWGAGAAGPPPGRPSGSVLDFGIYLGWSLGEVDRRDPGYLDWLVERPEGVPFRGEILEIQARRQAGTMKARRGLFGFG
ncbi:MAG: DnaJ domain-containing protein [Chloroflexi bacterium]|nr:DnaJ domain-containing protein [Chloroflexota bacterium]